MALLLMVFSLLTSCVELPEARMAWHGAGWLAQLSSAPRPPAMAASDGATATAAQQPAAPSAPLMATNAAAKHNGKQADAAALHADFDEDDGTCVVCLDRPCEAGFLHGER